MASANDSTRELINRVALLTLEVVRLSMTWCHNTGGIGRMTSSAIRRLPLINTLIVTGSAFRDPMRPAQREARKVMVKASLLPEILRMTVLARQQLSVMRIILMMTLATFLT